MRDWLTKDIGWKIFSVVLALVIWLTVHNVYPEPGAATTQARENTYGNLPVLVVSGSADVHNFRVEPATVSVTVRGPPGVMSTLQADEVRATVDLSGVAPGKDLQRKVEVSTPLRVTLVSVDPPKVGVLIPPATSK
ncbi:MAG TPA: CdaR family protein [Verrucomicrobiae bacterium]